jgi:ribonuclease P protein component
MALRAGLIAPKKFAPKRFSGYGFDPPAEGACVTVMITAHNPLRNTSGMQINSPRRLQSLTDARLRKHADYQRAYAASRKRQSASMSWFLSLRQPEDGAPVSEGPRVGLTAGKVLGKAHERNRIKRRMREALRRNVGLLPAGCDLILHPRRAVLTLEFAKLEAEIVRILGQANAEAARMKANSANSARPAPAP